MQVLTELMPALWALLKPNNSLAIRTILLLGKLGGRNRRWCVRNRFGWLRCAHVQLAS